MSTGSIHHHDLRIVWTINTALLKNINKCLGRLSSTNPKRALAAAPFLPLLLGRMHNKEWHPTHTHPPRFLHFRLHLLQISALILQHRSGCISRQARPGGGLDQHVVISQILLVAKVRIKHGSHELILLANAVFRPGPFRQSMRIERVTRHAAEAVLQPLVGEHLGHTGDHRRHTIGTESRVVVLQFVNSSTGGVGIEEEGFPRNDEADAGRGGILPESPLEAELPDVAPRSYRVAYDVDRYLDGWPCGCGGGGHGCSLFPFSHSLTSLTDSDSLSNTSMRPTTTTRPCLPHPAMHFSDDFTRDFLQRPGDESRTTVSQSVECSPVQPCTSTVVPGST
mmetsp:Transcript_8085/g.17481  ORF Transcript_8085/g.17481 Transcript_8085/m.17481 type:complete len:338 (+) Transcript_8085:253-1266(+)